MTEAERAAARNSDAEIATIQAVVHGVPDRSGQLEFMGEWFRLPEKVGILPSAKFASAVRSDEDMSGLDALVAVYEMLQASIYAGADCSCRKGWTGAWPDPDNEGELTGGAPDSAHSLVAEHDRGCTWDAGDWGRFERHANKMQADLDDLLPFANTVLEAVSARPTKLPSGSSGRDSTPSRTTTASSSRAQAKASRR